jgi:SAM-dependent methyltransferase
MVPQEGHVATSKWVEMTRENPEHSRWYIERFRSMAAAGEDLDGEARLVDAMAARQSRVLDAGCGPGRVGGALAERGHSVIGVDVDPELIAAAEQDHPGPRWIVADLALMDLPSLGIDEGFDLVVCAGNVMTFLAPSTRLAVLERFRSHLRTNGRIVVGFGAGRDYEFEDFIVDAERVGLRLDGRFASWDLRPFGEASEFLVAILSADS